ncbi:RNA recognition motif domain-containing protein [Ferrimonas marina]|uniref:RNA recognition motif. (A.k.a. RRM, RBD, or RNP domain) n=1 Tax=Ferrimonas marina TaxID=299255 RepID=A0A1M5Z6B5_9GAMM|nr:RNA-binding protein [Ferrimonas marina]SHI19694.1 RNA recognition motif. (a.k.a. RRM, RBD, or RNP domain) [Ferrimonas marina]
MDIYVGNLAYSVDKTALQKAFEAFGKVLRCTVVMDRESNQSKGFGFVQMANRGEGEAAIAALHGQSLEGRTVRVNEAKPRNC